MNAFSISLIKALQTLCAGGSVASSSLRADMEGFLLSEGLLTVITNKSRKKYAAVNAAGLESFLKSNFDDFRDADATVELLKGDDFSRSRQALISGNSKRKKVNTCPGFLVNSYSPIPCTLNRQFFTVYPLEGSFQFVYDWQSFVIPGDVVVMGMENMENFIQIRKQKRVFNECLESLGLNQDTSILFVSRYPQSKSLRYWLEGIPNKYVHFGDFDLEGINIYQTNFANYIGDRASFLIPSDIEYRIRNGTKERYDKQYAKDKNITSSDPKVQWLIDIINRYRRGYDQEGYIEE